MEYKMYCKVSHGVCWNGGVREYQGEFFVNLDEREIKTLQEISDRYVDDEFSSKIEEMCPSIYEKIEKASLEFRVYTFVLDTCVHWNPELGESREEVLIEEDMKAGKFVPLYVNAEGSSMDPLIVNQWFCSMIDHLKDLSYGDRTKYLVERYGMELPSYDEIDFETTYGISKI